VGLEPPARAAQRGVLNLLAVVDDVFFSARIRETARQVGASVEVVGAAQFARELEKRLEAGSIGAVIVDLEAPSAVDLISTLKSDARTSGLHVVGFASHVASHLIQAAREAGCDQVLARSAFTRQLAGLLRQLAAPGVTLPFESRL
jgi:DNA-binding NarL/FixJ family response regulator